MTGSNGRNTARALIVAPFMALCLHGAAWADYLGSAQAFGVLAGSTVTNTGPTQVDGSVGVWPGTAITGFPPGIVTSGSLHFGDAVAQLAQSDAAGAYSVFAGMAVTENLTGQDLGGMTLTPGVYFFESSAMLSTTITLDGLGDPNALFVFQIGSTLTTASASSVNMINGADGCNIYWQVGSSATLGTATDFVGNILALASITMNTNASLIEGRAIALTGAVTLDSNIIHAGCIPTPGAVALLGLAGVGGRKSRRRMI